MDCDHKLTLREVLSLESNLSLNKPITYTCAKCRQQCELTLKSEWKLLALAVALLVLIIAAAVILPAVSGLFITLVLLFAILCVCLGAAAYAGMICLYYRLGKFEYTAVSYHSIVDRRKLNKR